MFGDLGDLQGLQGLQGDGNCEERLGAAAWEERPLRRQLAGPPWTRHWRSSV